MSDDQWRPMTPTERERNEPAIREALQPLFDRIDELEKQVHRLRAFAEEMSWYAPEEDWDDAARRILKYGDVHPIAEIRAATRQQEQTRPIM